MSDHRMLDGSGQEPGEGGPRGRVQRRGDSARRRKRARPRIRPRRNRRGRGARRDERLSGRKRRQVGEKRFGSVDVLVNNAGHGYRAAVEEGDDGEVAALFATNFFGTVSMIKAVLPGMRARREVIYRRPAGGAGLGPAGRRTTGRTTLSPAIPRGPPAPSSSSSRGQTSPAASCSQVTQLGSLQKSSALNFGRLRRGEISVSALISLLVHDACMRQKFGQPITNLPPVVVLSRFRSVTPRDGPNSLPRAPRSNDRSSPLPQPRDRQDERASSASAPSPIAAP